MAKNPGELVEADYTLGQEAPIETGKRYRFKLPAAAWVELTLTRDDGEPERGAAWRLTLANGEQRAGTLDGAGKARVEGLPPGEVKLSFPDLDGGEWGPADEAAGAAQVEAAAGGTDHTVTSGDTALLLAAARGFRRVETIWEHPKNAGLREQRPDPNMLAPGDALHLPDKRPREVPLTLGQANAFKVRVLGAKFSMTVEDAGGQPLAQKRFALEVGPKRHEGTTDAAAHIELEVDPTATRGTLTVWVDEQKKIVWSLALGHLHPIETTTGVQARLNNLGFREGPLDGELDGRTKAALRAFQTVHGLTVSGEPDDATRQKLVAEHDGQEAA